MPRGSKEGMGIDGTHIWLFHMAMLVAFGFLKSLQESLRVLCQISTCRSLYLFIVLPLTHS
jgi:hypothetical protein